MKSPAKKPAKKPARKPDTSESDSYFKNYDTYAGTVRAWLVAYGIGGPVLFLTNEKAAGRVASSKYASEIIIFFLLGVGLQVVLSLINKWAAWHIYAGAVEPHRMKRVSYRVWDWINKQSWLDASVDVISFAGFVWATFRVLSIFLGKPE